MGVSLASTTSSYYESFIMSSYRELINHIKANLQKGTIIKSYKISIKFFIKKEGKWLGYRCTIMDTEYLFPELPKSDLELYQLMRQKFCKGKKLKQSKRPDEENYNKIQKLRTLLSYPFDNVAVKRCLQAYRKFIEKERYERPFKNLIEDFRRLFEHFKEASTEEKYLAKKSVIIICANRENLDEENEIEFKKSCKKRCHGPECKKMMTTVRKLKRCAKCLVADYCGETCRIRDWEKHIKACIVPSPFL